MSFGESKFSVGFIQKTISGDQNIKVNHIIRHVNNSRRL
jgi:hypothetical protein